MTETSLITEGCYGTTVTGICSRKTPSINSFLATHNNWKDHYLLEEENKEKYARNYFIAKFNFPSAEAHIHIISKEILEIVNKKFMYVGTDGRKRNKNSPYFIFSLVAFSSEEFQQRFNTVINFFNPIPTQESWQMIRDQRTNLEMCIEKLLTTQMPEKIVPYKFEFYAGEEEHSYAVFSYSGKKLMLEKIAQLPELQKYKQIIIPYGESITELIIHGILRKERFVACIKEECNTVDGAMTIKGITAPLREARSIEIEIYSESFEISSRVCNSFSSLIKRLEGELRYVQRQERYYSMMRRIFYANEREMQRNFYKHISCENPF